MDELYTTTLGNTVKIAYEETNKDGTDVDNHRKYYREFDYGIDTENNIIFIQDEIQSGLTFDIVSKVDIQVLDNAVNVTKKEITNRFDFKGSHVSIELDKKTYILQMEADSDMKMEQIVDVLITRSMRQGLDSNCFDMSKEVLPSGKIVKKAVPVKNGIAQDDAKKIVKLIKENVPKVQAAIMDDIIRVTGKKIDDLQEVIQLCKTSDLKLPLQFVNMK
jgi:uncharacterized protein YajQ (UPF0234 family)